MFETIESPQEYSIAQNLIKDKVNFYLDVARKTFRKDFPNPVIEYCLHGATAGKAITHSNGGIIKLNPTLLRENFGTFLRQTVGHEVAHLVQFWQFGFENNTPHGHQWAAVMRAFNLPAQRCHNYDVSNVPSRRRPRKLELARRTESGFVRRLNVKGMSVTTIDFDA